MKKKFIAIASLSTILVGSVLATGFAFGFSGSYEPLKATEKEFTFNESVAASQFTGSSSDVYEKSVVTGVSSNLETSVSLQEGSTERVKAFGDGNDGYFVANGGSVSAPTFYVTIGVNNPTSVSVTFRLIKTASTTTTEVRCEIAAYNGNTWLDELASSGDSAINDDYTVTWTKKGSQETPANIIKIEVSAINGFVYWGEPLYIKAIALNWSC